MSRGVTIRGLAALLGLTVADLKARLRDARDRRPMSDDDAAAQTEDERALLAHDRERSRRGHHPVWTREGAERVCRAFGVEPGRVQVRA